MGKQIYSHLVTGNARMSSRITSVAGLPVCSQYFSRLLASFDVKFMVIRLTAHFLFILKDVNRVIIASDFHFTFADWQVTYKVLRIALFQCLQRF